MKGFCQQILIIGSIMLAASINSADVFAQLNKKFKTDEKGSTVWCYHKNGKPSTEEFLPKDHSINGYAKAYDSKGKLIFEQSTSRMHMLTSVHFHYYDHGAVRKAHISSHPDAGTQWSTEDIEFDEIGQITSRTKMQSDNQGHYQLSPKDFKKEEELAIEKEKENKIQFQQKDSIEFYKETLEKDPTGSLVTKKTAFPTKKYTLTEWLVNGKKIRDKYAFYKSEGIQEIHRSYFSNGKIESETIEEKVRTIKRSFDKNGLLTNETIDLK